MSRCNSCQGILGRDCFNPQECAEISRSMEQNQIDPQYVQHLEQQNEELKARINILEQTINQKESND